MNALFEQEIYFVVASDHKVRDCRNMKGQEKGGQDQAIGFSEAPKKSLFHALRFRGE